MQVNRIQKDATLGVFSPSEPIIPRRAERLAEEAKLWESFGYTVKFAPNVYAHDAYAAGTIDQRISDIHELVDDKSVDALIASWGGKNCNQLVPYLDYDLIGNAHKPILGFSDVGVMLNAVYSATGLFTFYGPNVAGKVSESKHGNLEILRTDFYANNRNLLGSVDKIDVREVKTGKRTGRLIGGNLSTLVLGLVGSKYLFHEEGDHIFFWETSSSPPQIIDQYLTCLRNAGFFEHISAMVIGDFIREEKNDYKATDPFKPVMRIVEEYDIPTLYCPTFGHGEGLENPIFPIGAMCELDVQSSSLKLLEAVIS